MKCWGLMRSKMTFSKAQKSTRWSKTWSTDFTQPYFATARLDQVRHTRWMVTNTKSQKGEFTCQLSMKIPLTEVSTTAWFRGVWGCWSSRFNLSRNSRISSSMSRSCRFIMREYMICWTQGCSSAIRVTILCNQLFTTLVPIQTQQVSSWSGIHLTFTQ